MGHETPRNRTAVGEAAPTGDPAAKSGQEPVGRGTCRKRVCEFGVSLVPGLPHKGLAGTTAPSHSGPSAQALPVTEDATGGITPERPPGSRISDGSVDLQACRRTDSTAVGRGLSPLPCLETPGRPRMELSEAGASSSPTGRRGHRPLEAVPLAAYKKTLKGLAPIWSSSMNPVSCSSPTWPAPGPPKDRRRLFAMSTNTIESRRSAPWPCPPSGDDWPSISIFAPTISRGWMSGSFSHTCSGIFEGRWSCSGIGEPSIAAAKSRSGSDAIQDSRWNRSRPTPRNSIQRSMCGTKPTAPWPTARPRTWSSFTGCSDTRSDASGDRRRSSGPASTRPICPGQDESFHYLCKPQYESRAAEPAEHFSKVGDNAWQWPVQTVSCSRIGYVTLIQPVESRVKALRGEAVGN